MPIHVEGVERTYTRFLLITFLIFNQFSIRKKFWKADTKGFSTYHQILSMSEVLKVILTFDTSDMLQHT